MVGEFQQYVEIVHGKFVTCSNQVVRKIWREMYIR